MAAALLSLPDTRPAITRETGRQLRRQRCTGCYGHVEPAVIVAGEVIRAVAAPVNTLLLSTSGSKAAVAVNPGVRRFVENLAQKKISALRPFHVPEM